MHPAEIERALEEMVILVDTREQDTPSLRARLRAFGKHERQKLDAGDYSARFPLPDGEWLQIPVAIERKMSLDELAGCYCRGRDRFRREFERAQKAGVKLYLLIENATWEDLYAGRYRSQMEPKSFVASLLAWLARYDCQLLFCEPQTTGRLIHDTLYREGREALGKLVDDA